MPSAAQSIVANRAKGGQTVGACRAPVLWPHARAPGTLVRGGAPLP